MQKIGNIIPLIFLVLFFPKYSQAINTSNPPMRWPLHKFINQTNILSQGYGERNDVSDKHHAGLDIPAIIDTPVFPAADGWIVMVQENHKDCKPSKSCATKGSTQNCKDKGFGNTAILGHRVRRPDGTMGTVYTQYSHLNDFSFSDSIKKNLTKFCGPIDFKIKDGESIKCDGNNVFVGIGIHEELGRIGGSGYGDENCYSPHLHFATRRNNQGQLCTTATNIVSKECGYTSQYPTNNHIDLDPLHYLHHVFQIGRWKIKVTDQGDGVPILMGPGCNTGNKNNSLYRSIGTENAHKNTNYYAVSYTDNSCIKPACSKGWYQIEKANGTYFSDNPDPLGKGTVGHGEMKYGWICKGDNQEVFASVIRAYASLVCDRFVTIPKDMPRYCGFELTQNNELKFLGSIVSQPLVTSYLNSTVGGSIKTFSQHLVIFPSSKSGRFNIVNVCDDTFCSPYIFDRHQQKLVKTWAGKYGPGFWIRWSPDEKHVVLAYSSENAYRFYVIDVLTGVSIQYPSWGMQPWVPQGQSGLNVVFSNTTNTNHQQLDPNGIYQFDLDSVLWTSNLSFDVYGLQYDKNGQPISKNSTWYSVAF